jgi:hypothetical protein
MPTKGISPKITQVLLSIMAGHVTVEVPDRPVKKKAKKEAAGNTNVGAAGGGGVGGGGGANANVNAETDLDFRDNFFTKRKVRDSIYVILASFYSQLKDDTTWLGKHAVFAKAKVSNYKLQHSKAVQTRCLRCNASALYSR